MKVSGNPGRRVEGGLNLKKSSAGAISSSETQGQLVGGGGGGGKKSKQVRKLNWAKKSQERKDEPLGTRF